MKSYNLFIFVSILFVSQQKAKNKRVLTLYDFENYFALSKNFDKIVNQ